MGRQKKIVSPSPKAYSRNIVEYPEMLRTEIGTKNQIRNDIQTYIWGNDDALPARILKAVSDSPTTEACVSMNENFIRGDGFTDKALQDLVIDAQGGTLWQLHCQICAYFAYLDGFSVNFKFNPYGRKTAAYNVPLETVRMVAPQEGVKTITEMIVNPYFGTIEFNNEYSKKYPVYNPDQKILSSQFKEYGTKFPGQIYFYGANRPLFKHYPVPKYWSAENAIYSDSKMMEFTKYSLQNGFFQSVLITMKGDPDAPSTNPQYQKTVEGSDGVKRKVSTKTRGQEFDEYMSATMAGTNKAASAMVTWATNTDNVPSVQTFPSNLNFDLLNGSDLNNIRKITIATQVPAILVNLPQQENSLGSDGNAIEKSIELMQSRTSMKRKALEQFYNNVLLKDFEGVQPGARVEIVQYRPVQQEITIEDKFWEALPQPAKTEYLRKIFPNIQIPDAPPIVAEAGAGGGPTTGDMLRKLSRKELSNFYGYVNDFKNGRATLEQTLVFLKSFGLNEDELKLFLTEL